MAHEISANLGTADIAIVDNRNGIIIEKISFITCHWLTLKEVADALDYTL